METFVVYLLKTGMWVGVFWLVYWLFLRQETFYRFNRYYLLAGLILPFIIPFVQLRYTVKIAVPVTSGMPANLAETLSTHTFDWTFVWLLIYGCGIVAIAVRYLVGLRKIAVLLVSQSTEKTGSFHVVDSPGFRHPFSVFNYIFMNRQATSDMAQKMILEHEQAHIRQRHWIDLTICNLACILQWFNPFAWLYIKAMKQNHEYLADQSVLQNGYSPAIYQAVLLSYTLNIHASALVHSFAHTGKASRFRMMKKAASNPLRKGVTLLIFPALAVFLWAFAQPVYMFDAQNTSLESLVAVTDTTTIRKNVNESVPVKETEKPKPKTAQQSPKPEPAKPQASQQSIKPEPAEPEPVIIEPTLNQTNEEDVQVAGFNKFEIISPKLVFKPKTEQGFNMQPEVPKFSVAAASVEANPPLVLLDGKEIPYYMLKTMDINTIESIDVNKDKSSIALYGEKGKNGVISIQTKIRANPQKITE